MGKEKKGERKRRREKKVTDWRHVTKGELPGPGLWPPALLAGDLQIVFYCSSKREM